MASSVVNEFSCGFFKRLLGGSDNVFVSPHSVASALMLACLGAKGETAGQIASALSLQGTEPAEWHSQYSGLCARLTDVARDGGPVLEQANKLFANLDIEILDSFKTSAEKLYKSGIDALDFAGKSDESRIAINVWVEEQTKGKITDLLLPGSVSPATKLVLANAIYFNGKWDKPFKATSTTDMDFHKSANETVTVKMMREKLDLRFLCDDALNADAVELGYQHNLMSMIIIRPRDIDGLPKLQETLDAAILSTLFDRLLVEMRKKVDLGLPKFNFAVSTDVSRLLPQLGITDLFDSSKADLSGMTSRAPLAISDVIHKAVIDVNEEGTEAAAATGMITRMMVMPTGEETFICDRPFLFFIVEPNTRHMVFAGRFSSP